MKIPLDIRLYLVTDATISHSNVWTDTILQAIKGGISTIQLREKNKNTKEFLQQAIKLKQLLIPYRIPLLINDRVDIACACNADGVHLGQTDLPYPIARKILGPHRYIGLSIETWEQAEQANDWDVDYLGISPIFPTTQKPELSSFWGLDGLQKLRSFSKHTLVAIGGINEDNVSSVIKAGADGIAMISAIFQAPDPQKAAYQLKNKIIHLLDKQI